MPKGGMRIIPTPLVTDVKFTPQGVWSVLITCKVHILAHIISGDDENLFTDDELPFECKKKCDRPRCVVGYEPPKGAKEEPVA